MVDLSAVVPMYGCRDCLPALHQRLRDALAAATPSYEIIYVDDGSPDGTWPHLVALASMEERVRAVKLSRNFGQHAAITAGLEAARGRFVAVLDCDLQDPPEELPRLYAKALEGADVVLTKRSHRRQSLLRRLGGHFYFRLRQTFLKDDIGPDYSTLSVLSRKVVDAFLRLQDRDRQYMLLVHWLGFNRETIEIEPAERHAGRSSYTLPRLIQVAVDGIFFQTTTLLHWIVYLGFAVAAAGGALAVYDIIFYFNNRVFPGWTSLAVIVLVIGGFIITSLGVTALYIGKIFEQVKGRPLYVVDTIVGDTPVPDELLAETARETQATAP